MLSTMLVDVLTVLGAIIVFSSLLAILLMSLVWTIAFFFACWEIYCKKDCSNTKKD